MAKKEKGETNKHEKSEKKSGDSRYRELRDRALSRMVPTSGGRLSKTDSVWAKTMARGYDTTERALGVVTPKPAKKGK